MKSSTKLFFPLAIAMLLTACGGGSSSATPSESAKSSEPPVASSQAPVSSEAAPSSQAPDSEPPVFSSWAPGDHYVKNPTTIYLTSSFNDKYQQAINTVIEEFKAIEPNVTIVNQKETGSYDDVKTKVINQVATQEHPDMFVGYPDAVQEVLDYGVGADMTPFINNADYGWSKNDLRDIFPAYLEEGSMYSIPGSYSLPMCKSTEALYYNADVLIGLNLAAYDSSINGGAALSKAYLDDLTWEDFFDHLCPALLAYNEAQPSDAKIFTGDPIPNYGYRVLGYDSDANLFITLAEQYGYGYTSIDQVTGEGQLDFVNDGMKGLMTKFREYYNKGYILTGGTYSESSYTSSLFTAGQMLFCIGSTAGATHQYSQDFATGVARLPRATGKARKVISQGPSLGFLSHKKNNEIDQDRMLASWLFYKFFTETENATNWAITTDYLPIRYSVSETDDYLKYSSATGKTGEAVVKAATAKYGATEVGNDLYSSPVFRGSGEARNQANSLVVGCLSTDTSIDELFQKAYAETLKKM